MANRVTVPITATDEGFKQTIQTLQQNAEKFADSLGKAGKQTKTFNGQLRMAKKEAMELANAYSQLDNEAKNSDFGRQMYAQMQEALKVAGEMTDLKQDVIQNINALASDTLVWDGMKEGIGVVSSGLQGLASIYGLCGGETKEFAQALVAVNAVQSVANTLVGIGNSLQKQSALMTMLRTVRSKLFTAQQITETAAVKAGTLAQLKLNLAVLANPYVAAAAAIAALAAGIYLWIDSMDDATDEQKALNAAIDAVQEQFESQSDELGKTIAKYQNLEAEYANVRGDSKKTKEFLEREKDTFKELGLKVDDAKDAELLFTKQKDAFIKASIARTQAMAIEAAQAQMIGKVMAELSKVYAKLAKGEEVDWKDIKDVGKDLGIDPKKIEAALEKAGGNQGWDWIYSNLEVDKSKLEAFTKAFTNEMTSLIKDSPVNKALQASMEGASQAADEELKKIESVVIKKDKTDKTSKNTNKTTKNTKDEIKKILTSLEGCDAIISDAEKKMKKLDKAAGDYDSKMANLRKIILGARAAKLNLLDTNTLSGLNEASKIIQQIINDLPKGDKSLDEWNKALEDINKKRTDMVLELANRDTIEGLENAKSEIEKLLKTLPVGSQAFKDYLNTWRSINSQIDKAEQTLDDMKQGINAMSEVKIQANISELQKERDKLNPFDENQKKAIDNYNAAIKEQEDLLRNVRAENAKLKKELFDEPQYNYTENRNLSESYEKATDMFIRVRTDVTDLDKVNSQIDLIKESISWLDSQIARPDISDEEMKMFKDNLQSLSKDLLDLTQRKYELTIETNLKEVSNELAKISFDSFRGGIEGIHSMYDAIDGMVDKVDNAKNAFEQFFAIFDGIFSIVDTILSMVETFNALSQAITTFNAVNETTEAISTGNAASLMEQGVATQGLVAAKIQETGVEEANIPVKLMSAKAASKAAIAQMDLAAANIAAAHSSLMFVGPAIAAAGIGTVTAAVAAAHGTMMGLQAFESGGIVRGSTTMGDQVLVRANANEMILNNRQQEHLFKIIDSGNLSTENTLIGTSIRVQGSDLYLALKNYGKIKGKGIQIH